jgi:filamentous hemagglutinin
MNKNLHRIIFNAKRGQRMAVAETATAQGKTAGGEAGSSRHPVLAAVVTAALAACAYAAIAFFALAEAQVRADATAPGNQRATVLAAPNGVPLINIQTPNAAGVSRNTYSQFDVQRNGVILNNSRTAVQTQLGGFVGGNPWMNAPASVILNEVNSSNPSLLRGYVEVAGQRASVIIANPSGIQVDGGGFINANRVTLTTGTPDFNSGGGIDSYRVRGGMVSITGLGLDASTAGFTEILARTVAINAGLFADQLQITTGANSISAADPNSATPIAGTGARPAFALDAGVLSGMYVNSITFKGTEDGLDIVHRGTIGVTANVLFQVNGGFTNTGSIQAQGIAQINAVGPVSNSGLVSAAQTLTLATAGALDNSAGSLSAARLDISAASLANRGGSIEQTGAQALSLQSQSVSNAAGGQIGQTPAAGTPASGGTGTSAAAVMLADGALRISGALNNDAGRINAAGVMDLSTSNGLNNDTGTLSLRQLTIAGGNVSNQGGTLRTQGDMRIEASQVQNQGGSLTAEGRLQFSVTGINNQGGEIVQTGAQDAAITVTGPQACWTTPRAISPAMGKIWRSRRKP